MTQAASNWLDAIPQHVAGDILRGFLAGGLLYFQQRHGEEVVFDRADVQAWIHDDEPDFAFLVVGGYCVLRVHRDRFGTTEQRGHEAELLLRELDRRGGADSPV